MQNNTCLNHRSIVSAYKSEAYDKLIQYNIEDQFTVKLKSPKNKNWVAIYRAYSQFNNGGKGPIFWINPELLSNPSEFVISILHEYGHVIAEYAWVTENNISSLLKKHWEGRYLNRPWDEEEFAEEFAQFIYGNSSFHKDSLTEIIAAYTASFK